MGEYLSSQIYYISFIYFYSRQCVNFFLFRYDKIKVKYGIAIHGCIDGFSRYLIWLCATTTNNDPSVVGAHYAAAIESLKGFPKCVRTDEGTENSLIRDFQESLKRKYNAAAGHPAYISGSSPLNQRIESYWGMLRRQCIQFYMNAFQELVENGTFDGGDFDKEILRYCFLELIQVRDAKIL